MSIASKIKTVVKNPKAAIDYLSSRKIDWATVGNFKTKVYRSYEEYIEHQKKKVDLMSPDFLKLGKEFGVKLQERLEDNGYIVHGSSVLCLGARLGFEVEAFINLGCFAVGVDLNPGKDNNFVVAGDFHSLVWADSSIDIVYTNSLDHSFALGKVIDEIARVLKPGGIMVLEVCDGVDEGYSFDYYESYAWDKSSDVIDMFAKRGFKSIYGSRYTSPDKGKHVVMKLYK